ncbi:MAG: DUF362 domain-containing protein [Fibrobacterota bacterium]
MPNATVAVLKTTPQTVLADTCRLMDMAGLPAALNKDAGVIVKNNISWHLMYPSANTTPWQMDTVLGYLHDAGFRDVSVVQNETVVTSAFKGERLNAYTGIYKKYGVKVLYNFRKSDMRWVRYEPKARLTALPQIFPQGLFIPDYFIGRNVIHLPTLKCHIYTGMTGAMKNAFGGLLDNRRHYCHSRIHEVLADLLAVQREIHPGIFTVMDGTTAGSGAGPRTMTPVIADLLLASSDSVAIDAVAARLMGFDPLHEVPCIRYAYERGLGQGDTAAIEMKGDDVRGLNLGFGRKDNLASRAGKLFWFGPFKPFQRLMFHTPLVYAFILASAVYHDRFWYPIKGRRTVNQWIKETGYGKLFMKYKETTL